MSVNLLDLAKGYMTDAIVDKASSFLGENSEITKSGIDHVLPALLGGLMSKSSTPSGASDLLNMVNRPEFGGSILDNIGDIFGGSNNSLLDLSGNLLGSLFGGKLKGITDLIGSVVGGKSGTSSALMQMALPLVIGLVKRKVANGGVKGLLNLLSGQKEHLAKAAPSGFMDKLMGTLGVGSLDDLTNKLSAQTQETVSEVKETAEKNVEESGGNGWLKYLVIAALVGAAFYLFRTCNNDKVEKVEDKIEDVATEVKEETKDVVSNIIEDANEFYNAGENLVGKTIKGFENFGEFLKLKLADGSELIVPSKGLETGLVKFIESDSPVDKTTWFDMRRLLFKTGSANLDDRSAIQINNLAAILKAYPKVNFKIGGYTDNTGDAALNKTLSANRATSVMKALIAKGIDGKRLSAEGYGVEHPVADNNTEEGRALNRRVSVRVTEK